MQHNPIVGDITYNSNRISIGADVNGNGVFNGTMTNLKIYNTSLSANQIYEDYNSYNRTILGRLVESETEPEKTT